MEKLRRRNNRPANQGFTLIEMAIVLVIIGLIIGAVLKGQDLIQNARAKKFSNFVRAAEVAQWTYYDRKGHFNGDDNNSGVIGNAPSNWEGFKNKPTNSTNLGSSSFNLVYGYDNSTDTPRNFIAVTPSGNTFSEDDLVFVENFDTSVDGNANGTDGNVICVEETPNTGENSLSNETCDTTAQGLAYFFD